LGPTINFIDRKRMGARSPTNWAARRPRRRLNCPPGPGKDTNRKGGARPRFHSQISNCGKCSAVERSSGLLGTARPIPAGAGHREADPSASAVGVRSELAARKTALPSKVTTAVAWAPGLAVAAERSPRLPPAPIRYPPPIQGPQRPSNASRCSANPRRRRIGCSPLYLLRSSSAINGLELRSSRRECS
jgi:hypothetical protein